jgi:hypothetical protein
MSLLLARSSSMLSKVLSAGTLAIDMLCKVSRLKH